MTSTEIPATERRDRASLTALQGRRLVRLLGDIHGRNAFYTRKLDEAGLLLETLTFPDDLGKLPLTTKAELVADQDAHPPWGTGPDGASEAIYPLPPDVLHDRPPPVLARHERELAVDVGVLESGLPRRPGRTHGPRLLPIFVRSVPWILDRVRSRLPARRPLRAGRRDVE